MSLFLRILLIGVTGILCVSCARRDEISVTTTMGRTVPLVIPDTFAGNDWEGKRIALRDYRGKVVLIDFWATSCRPCVAEMPAIQAAYRQYHARGFEVIGVTMDANEAKLQKFLRAHDMPWPQIKDPDGTFSNRYIPDAHGIPMTVLFGKDGTLLAADIPEDKLSARIQEALSAP